MATLYNLLQTGIQVFNRLEAEEGSAQPVLIQNNKRVPVSKFAVHTPRGDGRRCQMLPAVHMQRRASPKEDDGATKMHSAVPVLSAGCPPGDRAICKVLHRIFRPYRPSRNTLITEGSEATYLLAGAERRSLLHVRVSANAVARQRHRRADIQRRRLCRGADFAAESKRPLDCRENLHFGRDLVLRVVDDRLAEDGRVRRVCRVVVGAVLAATETHTGGPSVDARRQPCG